MNALDWLESQQQAVVFRKDLAGLTSCSQQIQLASGELFVLRQQNERASAFGINYAQEAQILHYLAPLSFSPKVYYHAENSSLLHWINGNSPTFFYSSLLKKLALQLAKLHLFPITEPLPKLNLPQRKRLNFLKRRTKTQFSLLRFSEFLP